MPHMILTEALAPTELTDGINRSVRFAVDGTATELSPSSESSRPVVRSVESELRELTCGGLVRAGRLMTDEFVDTP